MEYTAEQLNFFRLSYIVFDIVPEVLRNIFKLEWDALYTATHGQWDDTPSSYNAFFGMESPRNQTKNKRLLGLMSSGDRKKWDCTCLFYAILYSDSVGPRITSVVKKSADQIREIRNELAHNTTGMISDAEFLTSIQKIKIAFFSLKIDVTRIIEIENQKCFPTEDLSRIQEELQETKEELKSIERELENEKNRNAEPQSFCVLPPHPSHDTIYRKKEVDSIYQAMQSLSSKNKGETTVVYLSGNPGSGKSVMSKHIGEKCYDRNDTTEKFKFVMTLDASNLDTLLNSYMTFTEKLNCYPDSITGITTSKDLSKEEQILQLKALAAKQVSKFSKWWIIADNVIDLKLFSKFWPQGGEKTSGEGQILVTTQDSSSIGVSLSSHYHHVSLSAGMTEDDALELLSTVSGYADGEEAMMLKVCKCLDLQPLALSCTAVYVRSVRHINIQYTWIHCLKDLKNERANLETVYKKTSFSYKTPMTAAVNLVLQREITEEVMLHAFRFLSLIASDPIPLKYVVEYVAKCMPDEDMKTVAVRICSSSLVCSLVQETTEIGVHQVVYYCLQRHRNIRDDAVDMFTVVSAFSLIPVTNDEVALVDRLIVTRPLINHLVNIAKKLIEYVIKEPKSERILDDHVCSVLSRLSAVLYKNAILKGSRDFLQVLLALQLSKFILSKTREALYMLIDTNHVEFISNINTSAIDASVGVTMVKLGNVYQKLGRYQESITYYNKSLVIQTAVYGENHQSVGETMSKLGISHMELGRLQESITYYEKAIAIQAAARGENHPSVGNTMSNLGNTYQELGRLKESITYYEKALTIQTAAYGEDHPSVGNTMSNLGNTYQELGRLKESIAYYEHALAIQTAAYGENHPLVGNTMSNLGNAYGKLGRLLESITYYEKALSIKTAAYGENHPSVGNTMSNLGITYRELGRLKESIMCYQKALAIKIAVYGESHPSVANTMGNLGITYRELGRLHESITYFENVLAIQTAVYGESHPSVANTMGNLGITYRELGRLQESIAYFEKALNIKTAVYGENHPSLGNTLVNAGIAYRELGRLQESITYFEKDLAIQTAAYGANHPSVGNTMGNLGITYQKLGRFDEARHSFQEALSIYKNSYHENHPSISKIEKNLSTLLEESGVKSHKCIIV